MISHRSPIDYSLMSLTSPISYAWINMLKVKTKCHHMDRKLGLKITQFLLSCIYLPLTDSQILLAGVWPVPWDVPWTGCTSWAPRSSISTKHSGKVSRQWCKNCQIISEWGVPPVFLDNWTATGHKKTENKQKIFKKSNDLCLHHWLLISALMHIHVHSHMYMHYSIPAVLISRIYMCVGLTWAIRSLRNYYS